MKARVLWIVLPFMVLGGLQLSSDALSKDVTTVYEVAKSFYMEFLPEVKHVAGPELYNELAKKYLGRDVRHEWFIKGMSKEQLEKIRKFYEERYGGAQAR